MSRRTAPSAVVRRETVARHRRAVGAVLALGVLGVLGVAGTSAAWTDDAWFTTGVSAARVDLRGSADGATWSTADDGATAVTLPAVTGVTPTNPVVRTVHLWNASTVPLHLRWATDPATLGGGCVAVELGSLPTTALAGDPTSPAGASTTATVTFRVADGATPAACAGVSLGALEIVVQGSTS